MTAHAPERGLLAVIAIVLLASLTCVQSETAGAQAGSTGGSIGKQGKSVSGGEPQARPAARPPRPAANRRPETQRPAEPVSPCGGVTGLWTWFIGGDVAFKAGGTVEAVNGLTARWQCSDGIFTVSWSNGFVDRLTLSSDRSRLSGNNNIGFPVSATRK